jgi:hypothetical protein
MVCLQQFGEERSALGKKYLKDALEIAWRLPGDCLGISCMMEDVLTLNFRPPWAKMTSIP